MQQGWRTRIYAWWYFSIAAGFVLLAIDQWMVGERWWLVLLRVGIAVGFFLLGIGTLRSIPK